MTAFDVFKRVSFALCCVSFFCQFNKQGAIETAKNVFKMRNKKGSQKRTSVQTN